MENEDRSYVYEKAEQLAAETEEFLNEARWYSGVEARDAMEAGQISDCLEEAYNKVESIEELIEGVVSELRNDDSHVKANFELAADMLEELKRAKKILHESLDVLEYEDGSVNSLADKINDVYVNFDFESIEPQAKDLEGGR